MAVNPGSFRPGTTMSNVEQAGYNYAGSYGPTSGYSTSYASSLNPATAQTGQAPTAEVAPEQPQGERPPSYDDDFETRRMREQQSYEASVRATQEAQRQQNAISTIKGVLDSYGLTSLYNRIVGFIQDGYDENAVMILIRTTPEYKQRFPAMDALAQKGRAISEAEYISYEQTASNLERRYGLPQGMLMGNVTNLLTNEVSAAELNDRVLLASAASIQAPADIKQQFREYYGIDSGGLTAYFLDPQVATPLLEKQFASAVIGTEAARQGIGIDAYGAENLQSLGITQEAARQGFGQVAASKELTTGRGDVVTQQELISGTLAGDEKARQGIERAALGRLGRFQGGGEFLQTSQGAVGLGSATR